MKRVGWLLIIGLFCFLSVQAQQKTSAKPAPMPTNGAPTAAALKAAEDMMVSSGGSRQFDESVDASMVQTSMQAPEDKRAALLVALRAFMQKYCCWAVLKNDICMMYAHEFTEAELKQLAAFYQSPVGIKLLQKSPLITQTGMLIGQKAMTEHKAELDKAVTDLMK